MILNLPFPAGLNNTRFNLILSLSNFSLLSIAHICFVSSLSSLFCSTCNKKTIKKKRGGGGGGGKIKMEICYAKQIKYKMKQIIDFCILCWFWSGEQGWAPLLRVRQGGARLIMILNPLWKSLGCALPVGHG